MQTKNVKDFNTLRQDLNVCLFNHSLRAGSFTAGPMGLAIGTPTNLPGQLSTLIYHAISSKDLKLRAKRVSAGKPLKSADKFIHFVDKKDSVFNRVDNSDSNYMIYFLEAGSQ